jgi:hypothetical protein
METNLKFVMGLRTRNMVGDMKGIFEGALARDYRWFLFDCCVQRYIKITHDPPPSLFSVAQGIF